MHFVNGDKPSSTPRHLYDRRSQMVCINYMLL
jgi:hypothetical protein